MKEHAIPQDITGYKFHIVGNMTLKQFAETALGFVIAFFIFKTNLYPPVKWFLIIFSSGFGAALAFLPIEERPLDHWFITFFTILYKPTKFYWKKKTKVPEAFTYKPDKDRKKQEETIDLSPQRRQRITEYLQTVRTTEDTVDELDQYYRQRSSQLLSIFDDNSIKINYDRAEKMHQKPNLKVQVRSLIGTQPAEENQQTPETTPVVDEAPQQTFSLPESDIQLKNATKQYEPIKKKVLTTNEIADEISIPETQNIKVEERYKAERESMGKDATKQSTLSQTKQDETAYIDTFEPLPYQSNDAYSATLNSNLPFPTKPSKPNKLVGMVLSQDNDLINSATITLKKTNGTPVTAVKSNALGQFFVSSQLNNGEYIIEVKKSDYSFQPLTISLEGKPVDPLEIRSNE